MSFSGISNEHNSARNKEDNDRVIDPEFAILSHIIAASIVQQPVPTFLPVL